MYCSFVAVVSVFLGYYTVSSAAASADCLRQTGFPTNSTTYTSSSRLYLDCPKSDNGTCQYQRTTRYIEALKELNITTRNAEDVFDTFGKSFNVSFNDLHSTFVTYKPVNISSQVEDEGFRGNDVPQRCYTGVIQKDCFDDILIGTPVEACRPYNPGQTTNGPSDLGDETVRPDEPPASATAYPNPTATSNDSGAVILLGQRGWRSSLLTVTMVITIMKIGSCFIAF